MSDYVKCNHCGYYPSTNGYYCANCGHKVNNDDGVAGIAILLIALILVGSIIFATISLFQSLKRHNYKRAIWFGVGGILWSILMFIIYFHVDDKHDPEVVNIYGFMIWSNIIGIISSLISIYLSIYKLNKLNTQKVQKQTKAKNEYLKENLINKRDNKVSSTSITNEASSYSLNTNSKSSKSKIILIVVISLVVISLGILYTLYVINNHTGTNSEVENKSSNVITEVDNIPLKYSELSVVKAIQVAENALMQIYRKDYFNSNGTYPTTCSLKCDTVIIKDINGDNLPDGFIHYWGEDFEVYGNATQMGWLVLLNTGNNLEILHPSIKYRFEFEKFSDDTLVGIVPVFGGATCCPTSKNEVRYLFRNNDYKLISEKTIWEETSESNQEIENQNIENNEITVDGQSQTKTIIRDSRAKDVANVFWDSKYTLFCKLTDEPIFPNSKGEYDIWYASHEEPYPHHKILAKKELSSLLFYKFKDFEACKKWCDSKKNN
ncbi:MAG: hypothetical protein GX660_24180 [Clostridiaceae bacterium]|nr:hypothetical protein [Clostridiaceae bacterium]